MIEFKTDKKLMTEANQENEWKEALDKGLNPVQRKEKTETPSRRVNTRQARAIRRSR